MSCLSVRVRVFSEFFSAKFVFLIYIILCYNIRFCYGLFECHFDDPGLCGFTQDSTDDRNFLHHSGRTPTEGSGPNGDHTTGSGHYMYLEASDADFGATARLISPVFNGTVGDNDDDDDVVGHQTAVRITFWVHMNGMEMGRLRVFVKNATTMYDSTATTNMTTTAAAMTVVNSVRKILAVEGSQGRDWVQKNVTIERLQSDFQIIFEAQCGASATSDIAIDDVTVDDDVIVEITRPPPLQEFNCTFENPGLCGFTQDSSDDLNVAGLTARNDLKDHTFGNITGTYVTLDLVRRHYPWGSFSTEHGESDRNVQQPGKSARMISPKLSAVEDSEEAACLLFWYHMHGNRVGQLNVYVKNETDDGVGNLVWALEGDRGQVWRAAEIIIEHPLDFQIVFEFVTGNDANAAIDDVSLSRYECPGEHPAAGTPSVNCDFSQAEICYYTREESSFKWRWTNRATDSEFTGPSQDHTRGDELGFYVYISSEYQRPGSPARLQTPTIEAQRSPSCLEFWYHMYGSHMGSLSVFAKYVNSTDGDDLSETLVWTLAGNQGNAWHRASLLLKNMTSKFVMVFEGTLGVDYRTEIAIDDVQYYPNEECPEYPTSEPLPTTLPPGAASLLDCDFENDICNFTQAVDDVMDWSRARASALLAQLNYDYQYVTRRKHPNWDALEGPHEDHTKRSRDGSFITFWYKWRTSHNLRPNDRSRVVSPLIAAGDQPRCLTFFLYKEARSNHFFNVYLQEYGGTRSIDPAFAYFWQTDKKWRRVSVDIQSTRRPFNIIFEAVIPEAGRWGAYVVYGVDDVTVTTGKCERPQDFQGSCDFEDEDACGYAKGPWIRNSGPTPTENTGPLTDHTLGDLNGHYMYYETSQPTKPNENGEMLSPQMHFTGKQCMRFYYHASGNDTKKLEVYLNEHATGERTLLKKLEGRRDGGWQPVNVDIGIAGDFQITFQAYAGRGYRGDIAVDDIIFLPHRCVDLPTEMSCNFELGPRDCSLQNSPQNIADWEWYDAILGRDFPLSSRSTATNSFMFVTAPAQPQNPLSTASSEMFSGYLTVAPTHGDLCLSFEYIVERNISYHCNTQTISVSVEEKGGNRREVGSLSYGDTSGWNMKTLSLLTSDALRPYIVFRLVLSVSLPTVGATVGIDNVVLSSAACLGLGNHDPARDNTSIERQDKSTGVATGVTIFVIVVIVILCIVAYVFRHRLQSTVHRCKQSVTEVDYKRHDVGFINEENKETVDFPSVVNRSFDDKFGTDEATTANGASYHVNV